MTRHRWLIVSAIAAAAGGACWLVKLGFASASGGAENAAIATCYLSGVGLMVLGSTWIGTRLAPRRPIVLLPLFVAASPLVLFASYWLIDTIAEPTLGSLGPAWFETEAGIVVTGLVWLAFGLTALRHSRRSSSSTTPAVPARTA